MVSETKTLEKKAAMIFIVSKIHWLLFSWFWTRGNGSTDTTLQEKKVRKINRRFNTTKAFERCDNYAILLWLLSDILLWLFGLFTALHHSSKWQINCITPLKFSASLLHAFSRHSTKERKWNRKKKCEIVKKMSHLFKQTKCRKHLWKK